MSHSSSCTTCPIKLDGKSIFKEISTSMSKDTSQIMIALTVKAMCQGGWDWGLYTWKHHKDNQKSKYATPVNGVCEL